MADVNIEEVNISELAEAAVNVQEMETEEEQGTTSEDGDVELTIRPAKKMRSRKVKMRQPSFASPRKKGGLAEELKQLREMVKQQALSISAQTIQIKDLKRKSTTTKSYSSAPKALNNPHFPDTLRFDLEKDDQCDIEAFIQEFEDVTALVDKKYILATLILRLSKDVRVQLRHHNASLNSAGKSKMDYKSTIKWLRSTFQARNADDQIFQQLTSLKQGKQPMRTYVAKFHSLLHQLESRKIKLNRYTQRKFMLDGVKERVRSKALELPEYYSMPYDDLLKKLTALDEAMDKTSGTSVSAVSHKKLEHMIATAVKKHSGRQTSQPRRDSRFSTKDMKPLYTDTEWAAREQATKNKLAPSDHAELYCKDCYPVVDGAPGKNAQKACVYCRKLGHTINECKAVKNK